MEKFREESIEEFLKQPQEMKNAWNERILRLISEEFHELVLKVLVSKRILAGIHEGIAKNNSEDISSRIRKII